MLVAFRAFDSLCLQTAKLHKSLCRSAVEKLSTQGSICSCLPWTNIRRTCLPEFGQENVVNLHVVLKDGSKKAQGTTSIFSSFFLHRSTGVLPEIGGTNIRFESINYPQVSSSYGTQLRRKQAKEKSGSEYPTSAPRKADQTHHRCVLQKCSSMWTKVLDVAGARWTKRMEGDFYHRRKFVCLLGCCHDIGSSGPGSHMARTTWPVDS